MLSGSPICYSVVPLGLTEHTTDMLVMLMS